MALVDWAEAKVVLPGLSRQPGCLRCPQERLNGRNYCGACGNRLRRCEKKQVSVLFLDVCGFTALSERLDPEQVSEIMDRAFGIVLDVVHACDGVMNQFLGDGVMALFGEGPGEHHAGRALRAALALQERLEALRREVRRSHGLEFRVRIAVNTGPIVLGAIGAGLRDDYTATGDTTSVAAQLLRVAEPGQIVLTGRTRALATGHFEFVDLAPTALTEGPGAIAVHALTRRAPAHAGSAALAGV